MIDTPQKELLDKLKEELDSGMHREVCDTPPFWKRFTSAEIKYILDYYKRSN